MMYCARQRFLCWYAGDVMNPFTRFLRQWTDDKGLHKLVEHCDALEALVVRVYKMGEATPADEAEYQALRRWLQANYTSWEATLRPYWQQATVQGTRVQTDPFKALLRAERAADFVGDWSAMQRLPAAREALNRLVLAHGGLDESTRA
jgi:hypothetical protein